MCMVGRHQKTLAQQGFFENFFVRAELRKGVGLCKRCLTGKTHVDCGALIPPLLSTFPQIFPQ